MENKRAFFNYEIIEKIEAGMALLGSEVKSLRQGGADMTGAFARIINNECRLVGCNIAPYKQANIRNHEPLRERKLLLHKRQIVKIDTKMQQKGFTLVPLRIYFNDKGLAKVELGIARGKRQYDKRDKIKKRQLKSDVEKSTRRYKR
ncbi:MAG: SsrA-binding protein [Planctomycetes bacterium RBG_13_44_8b]|nr:MAG: SsrA-binding protein [Planctomycetes bacterium RBG_13_44_8b]